MFFTGQVDGGRAVDASKNLKTSLILHQRGFLLNYIIFDKNNFLSFKDEPAPFYASIFTEALLSLFTLYNRRR
jgi:hypothetical protein